MVKQIFFSISLLTLSFGVAAQFKPVAGTGYEWSNVGIHCLPQGNSYSSMKLVTGADTTIESVTYRSVWKTTGSAPVYYGALRDDTITGRTWYRFPFSETDGLIYDFSLQPGDTAVLVNQFLGTDTIRLLVTGRDSVLMNDQWRARIILSNFQLSLQEWWIEGIGSQWGVLNSGNSFYTTVCGSEELLCFWENGVQVYQNQAFFVCEFEPTAISEAEQKSSFRVYPVPAAGTLYLSGLNAGSDISVSDLSGRIMIRTIAGQADIKLDVSGFKPGIYILTVGTDEGRTSRTIMTGLK